MTSIDGYRVGYPTLSRPTPAGRRLSTLVSTGCDVDATVRDVAHLISELHHASGRSAAADEAGFAATTLAQWENNDAELALHAELLIDGAAPGRVVALARAYLNGRRRLITERIRDGRFVVGHGYLTADDIFVLDDGPHILDDSQAGQRLRCGDGLANIAALAMDLEWLGAPSLAGRLLSWYQKFTGDRWPASLAHHHVAFQAHLRAKIAVTDAARSGASSAPVADSLLAFAQRHLEAARVRLVLIGGTPDTGKTALARGLADRAGWVVVSSEGVRDELTKMVATTSFAHPLDAGIYAPTMVALTYCELLHRAEKLLERGESVVLDATWAHPAWRSEAHRIAEHAGADIVSIRCVALPGGTPAAARRVGDLLVEGFPPWPEATDIDTSDTAEVALSRARRLSTVS